MEWWKWSGKGLKWSEIVRKQPEMVQNGNGQKMGKMAPRPSWMVKNGKKKGLGWPGNGLKLMEIDSEWSQVV